MLSCEQIAGLLGKGAAQDRTGLTIVPCPEIDALLARGATSIDLRLGRWLRSFRQTRVQSVSLVGSNPSERQQALGRSKEHFVRFGEKFVLHPGRFVLGVTLEWLRLPAGVSGYVTGKSSLGRHGLVIETAAGIHPWFSGCLTLEMANVGEVPLELYPGMLVCQIFLHETKPHEHENGEHRIAQLGRFHGSRKPTLPEPKSDEIFQRLSAPEP